MKPGLYSTTFTIVSALWFLLWGAPVWAQWSEPTQAPPNGNTTGVIWNSPAGTQAAVFNIVGPAQIGGSATDSSVRGKVKFGDGFSGGVHRPGIWFDRSSSDYGAVPNIYRYQAGSGSDLNAIIFNNEATGADFIVATTGGGMLKSRAQIQAEGGICLGTTRGQNCITSWSQVQPDTSQFVTLFDDPGADPNDAGHILLDGAIVTTGRAAGSATAGRVKIGDGSSGSVHRPGLWLKPEGGVYDSLPNVFRYTGGSGESNNGLVIRNEIADANIYIDPAGVGKTQFSGQVRIGNQPSGSGASLVNRPGIWLKNQAGAYDGSYPNFFRYAGTSSTSGVQDSIILRNDISGADLVFDTAGAGLIDFRDPARAPFKVKGLSQSSFSTIAELGNQYSTVLAAGYFQATNNTSPLSQTYLGSISEAGATAGIFVDTASQNSVILGSAIYAANFKGPVLIDRLLKLGYNSAGTVATNTPIIETPQDLFITVAKNATSPGTKTGDIYVYDQAVATANELLHLDGEGNLFIKGFLSEAGTSGQSSSPTVGNITMLGMGAAADTDTNSPYGSDGEAKLYLGQTGASAVDETLYLRHKNYSSNKANLFVEGDFTVEGTLSGSGSTQVHDPAFKVTSGASSTTTIKGATTINNSATIKGQMVIRNNSVKPFLIEESDGSDILEIDEIFKVMNLERGLNVKGIITASGHIYAHSTQKIGDVAEPLAIFKTAQPGDVIIVEGDSYKKSDMSYDQRVIGVYSEDPSLVLADIEGRQPLAVSGFVKVNASAENGPIKPGDLLVSATRPGHAMRCAGAEKCFGAVVGKALEPLAKGTGKILMIVSLQ